MLLSGFTFIRNAIKYDFPIVEAVMSMLPIVDELIINLGKSDDGTEKLILELAQNNPKIKVIHSIWDDLKTQEGLILSEQTNIALQACRGEFCLYLQADEALHEKDHTLIRSTLERAKNENVDAFQFNYLHFYGGYSFIQYAWNWYPTEIRIIRKSSGLLSYGDAQSFKHPTNNSFKIKTIPAYIYHYGHAREPLKMKEKIGYFHRFWHGDKHSISVTEAYQLNYKKLVWFWSTHPNSYQERVRKGFLWSPKPKQVHPQLTEKIIIHTDYLNLALAEEVATLLERHGIDRTNIRIISKFIDWVSFIIKNIHHRKKNTLIDLSAERRNFLGFLLYSTDYLLGFNYRVAHCPNGSLSSLRCKIYHNISWGRHEVTRIKKSDIGFVVPENQYARQILRWLGIDC